MRVEADELKVGMGSSSLLRPPGRLTVRRAPPIGASSIVTVPPCCSAMALHHREPEAEAAGVAGAAVVETGEPVEHPLAVLDGDAGPVVVDGELDRRRSSRRCAARPPPACAAWRSALSRRLRTTRGELLAPAVHAPGRHPGGVDGHAVLAARSRRGPARRGRPRGASRSGAGRQLVEAGEVEQLAHRVLHALVLGEHALARPRASRCGRGCAARPRGSCGSTRAGCAARATRRTRTGVGVATTRPSRSSIAFIVRARRPTSSSVSGSGTRRWIVDPVIDSASRGSPRPAAARAR